MGVESDEEEEEDEKGIASSKRRGRRRAKAIHRKKKSNHVFETMRWSKLGLQERVLMFLVFSLFAVLQYSFCMYKLLILPLFLVLLFTRSSSQ